MAQYARHHPLRDWLRFLADAIDGGAIDQATALEASLANQLIPAPSVGTIPSDVFLSHLRILRGAALSFRNHGFIARDDYQRRAIGFCLERLHSFLILKTLFRTRSGFQDSVGFQIVVSETQRIVATV